MISPAAARIYMLGETRYAEGRFDEAVALWGHTLLQLPADPAADSVRHKLIARMGHGLLKAYGATGDASYLVDGQAMCELYIAKHESMFGDDEDAKEQRGEIYELLYEFDSRLDSEQEPVIDDEPDAATGVLATPSPDASEQPSDADADPDAEVRIVHVRRIAWADPDDPRVRAYLHSDRFLGPSLVDNGYEHSNEARVLVRVGGLPQPMKADDGTPRRTARRAGLAVVDAARPALEACYERAMSRDPVLAARIEVTLTVQADGSVEQPRLVDGAVVDGEGDACVAEALRKTQIDAETLDDAVAVAMPIHFFFQDAQAVANFVRIERPGTDGTSAGYTRTGTFAGLPPIDAFAQPRQPKARGIIFVDPDERLNRQQQR